MMEVLNPLKILDPREELSHLGGGVNIVFMVISHLL